MSFNNQTNNFFKQTTSGLITARKVFSLENIRRTSLLQSNELWHFQKNGTVTHPWKRMSNGASHWKNNIVVNHRRTFMGISSSRAIAPTALRFAGKFLLAADVGLSGEIKPSHVVTACLIGSSSTGVGAIFAGVYFIADIGTGLITGNSISQRLDGWVSSNYGKLELYEGLY